MPVLSTCPTQRGKNVVFHWFDLSQIAPVWQFSILGIDEHTGSFQLEATRSSIWPIRSHLLEEPDIARCDGRRYRVAGRSLVSRFFPVYWSRSEIIAVLGYVTIGGVTQNICGNFECPSRCCLAVYWVEKFSRLSSNWWISATRQCRYGLFLD